MKYDFLGVIVFGIVLLIGVAVIAAFITVGIFLIRALSRYVKSGNVRKAVKWYSFHRQWCLSLLNCFVW